ALQRRRDTLSPFHLITPRTSGQPMPINVVIPSLGESISEVVINSWLKPDGSYVKRDEDIVELETDKTNMPLPAPVAGVIRHSKAPGDTVPVGGIIAVIDESAAAPASTGGTGLRPVQSDASGESSASPAAPAAQSAEVRATPLAKKIAEESRVDLSKIEPTGAGGRVREQDVKAYVAGATAAGTSALRAESSVGGSTSAAPRGVPGTSSEPARRADAPGTRGVRRERMTTLRQRIATRLVEAQHTAAMLTTFNECDMTNVMALRNKHKDAFEKRHGVKLGFMSFFVKAAVAALEKYPAVNAFIVPGGGPSGPESKPAGSEVEYHDYCDIAVAVGTDRGLVVPVLRNCDQLSFAEIESGINALALKARDNKLALEDLQGGTFTISNGGVYGSLMSTPILNPPQSGILGMHNIVKRPVEDPENPGQIALRPMMYLALSYDHRIVDGAGAVGFLKAIKEGIEEPARLMLGV
ncbi:MAG: 2-oxoglutarate dehydrogenase complex dihydrolipoyllysine-residue succinyltransferase, partial [Phycisphaerales bacterium]